MKTIKILSFFVLSFVLISCGNPTKKENKQIDKSISKIEVYDFHSTRRCITCNAIESNTKYTLDTYFSKQLKDGKITFKTVNVDEKENNHLAEKFQATGTSLFLNIISKGKESQINLTNLAFMKGKNKDDFSKELKTKIETELVKL